MRENSTIKRIYRRNSIIWLAVILSPCQVAAAATTQGVVANVQTRAAANTAAISAALGAGGTVDLPRGTVYIDGPITTKDIIGCGRLRTAGSLGYQIEPHHTLGQITTRIVQIGKGPVLRISGTGFVANDPIELVGDGQSPIIEIEGRATPATGRHRFRDLVFSKSECAIHCLAGYYKDGKFVDEETHADNCIVEGCEFFTDTAFRCDNQQAVNWLFIGCVYNGREGEQTVADIRRGGHVKIYGPQINHPRTTLFRVRDYSPNSCFLAARDVTVDRFGFDVANFWFTVFDYAGAGEPEWRRKWNVTANVFIPTWQTNFDYSKLFKVSGKYYRDPPANLGDTPVQWNTGKTWDVRIDARPNK
jgi:hypothetical protein